MLQDAFSRAFEYPQDVRSLKGFTAAILNTLISVLLSFAAFQLIIATGHYAATLSFLLEGFIVHIREPGGSDTYFAEPATPSAIAEFFFWLVNVGFSSSSNSLQEWIN